MKRKTFFIISKMQKSIVLLFFSFVAFFFFEHPLAVAEKVQVRPVQPFFAELKDNQAFAYKDSAIYLSPIKNAPIEFSSVGAMWTQILPTGTDVLLEIRFLKEGKLSEWYELEPEYDTKHFTKSDDIKSAFLVTNKAKGYQYRVTLRTEDNSVTPEFRDLEFTFINSQATIEDKQDFRKAILARTSNVKTVKTEFEEHEDIPDFIDSDELLGEITRVKRTDILAMAEKPTPLKPGVIRNPPLNRVQQNINQISGDLKTSLNIIRRSEWGADESLRLFNPETARPATLIALEEDYYKKFASELKVAKEIATDAEGRELTWSLTYPEKISKIVVHHTATTRNLDNPKKAIRDIYYWHTVTKGWGDIGYNYIIDQQGNIYEGRFGGEMVVGAHAGRGNFGSIGIAILGNFENDPVPDAVVDSLSALIKEKTKQYNIDPTGAAIFRGEAYDNIMGHRDIGATSCPGEKLYELLPVIRKAAKAEYMDRFSSLNEKNSEYAFAFEPHAPIVSLDPGSRATIKLKIKNTGKMPWEKDGFLSVSDDSGAKVFLRSPERSVSTVFGKEVKTGETVEVNMILLSTAVSGSSMLSISLNPGGDRIIKNAGSLAFAVKKPAPKKRFDYQLVSLNLSKPDYKPGDIVDVMIRLKNNGIARWEKTGNNRVTLGADKPRDHLNQLLVNPSARLAENMKEDLVFAGQNATFEFRIKIPEKDGVYREYFTPVIEGITWMENQNTFLEITVGNGTTHQKVESVTTTPVQSVISKGNIADHKFDVTKRPRNIRVDLSYRGNPVVISGDGGFILFEGTRKISDFRTNEKVTVKLEANKFIINSNDKNFEFTSPPRFVPVAGTIMRIDNWERRNTWGDRANNNEFRGTLEVFVYDNELHVLNELSLEDYMKGIAEVGSDAPYEKIKTIMIIARTYARFYQDVSRKFPGAPFDLNDHPDYSQKYLGYSFEKRSPLTVKAASETAGEYVTYDGRLIKTPYFNKSNGKTISAFEKWGWTDTPFLISVDDSLCDSKEFNGHGVGLSGCGSDAMARAGKNYREIISYYYRGAEITKQK